MRPYTQKEIKIVILYYTFNLLIVDNSKLNKQRVSRYNTKITNVLFTTIALLWFWYRMDDVF